MFTIHGNLTIPVNEVTLADFRLSNMTLGPAITGSNGNSTMADFPFPRLIRG